ncbi:MAG: ParB/RepB/Spo0J family partition protein [Eubacteriales bacterium]|nr:ParB/RepB/Spo0J family partition protein [Eubacteriales bacterium]
MNKKNITYIAAEHIRPHPENPRKNLGDLSELTESIRKNGVLQNLTVVPVEGEPGEYMTLIGHRRYAAGVQAEVTEFPCQIKEGLSRREQVSIMLEENMQRNDLTIMEQAQGFQLMLDLGETEDTIAEKTGFSKTTVRHRLNIAKLDQKELKKKEQDECFQLTLKDLYELEKVKDVKTRNKILKEASDSRNLASRAQSAVAEAKRQENAKIIAAMLKKLGVKKAPKEVENEQYSGKWKTVKEFELDEDAPKRIKLPETESELLYLVWYRNLKVIMKAPKEKRELSPWEKEQKEKDKAKRRIKAVLKESTVRRKEFIQNIISGKISAVKDSEKEIELIWQGLVPLAAYVSLSTLRRFFLDKDEYKCTDEEKKAAQEKADGLSMLHQMLIILHDAMASTNEPFDWKLQFNQVKGDALMKGYEALEPYGWYFEREDEKKVLDGTYELYAKENGEKNE